MCSVQCKLWIRVYGDKTEQYIDRGAEVEPNHSNHHNLLVFFIVAKGWEHELACIRGQRSETLRNLWEWTCLWGLHSAAKFVFEKLRRKTISSSVCCWSSCRSRAAGTAGGSLENDLWWSSSSSSLTSPPSSTPSPPYLPPPYSPSFQVYREVARTLAQMHSIQLPEGRRNPGVIIIITIIIIIITIIIIILIFIFASSSYSSQQTLHFYKYIFLKTLLLLFLSWRWFQGVWSFLRKLASLYPDREMHGLLTKEQLEKEVAMVMVVMAQMFDLTFSSDFVDGIKSGGKFKPNCLLPQRRHACQHGDYHDQDIVKVKVRVKTLYLAVDYDTLRLRSWDHLPILIIVMIRGILLLNKGDQNPGGDGHR